MALNLLDSFGVKGVSYGLYTKQADVIDTDYLSRYFVVSEFNSTLTAGKNPIAINGSSFLSPNSEILMECLDAQGNNLFIEMATYTDDSTVGNAYKEGNATIVSIHVYGDTADGVGKIILYGTLTTGQTVKWTQNVVISKTQANHSRVRFYQTPTLEVQSADLPVLSSDISQNLVSNASLTGHVTGLAVTPTKGTNQSTVNSANVSVDYRLILTSPLVINSTPDMNAFNFQMNGATVTLNINSIQSPSSLTVIPVSITASYTVTNVLNNSTLQINSPFYYLDGFGNQTITNIVDATFEIDYPFINYNNSTASYQTTTIGGVTYIIKQSYADISYTNIRAFSGYVARHKIYRKSLLDNADFSVIADEPIQPNQVLIDDFSQNEYFALLGQFYNQQHINRYWFTSSNNISLNYTPSYAANSMLVSAITPPTTDYFMVKNDSVPTNRDAIYVPFDMDQFLAESGSAYDSNFMVFKANVQYAIDVSAVIQKVPTEMGATLALYITSSYPGVSNEQTYTPTYGVKIAEIVANSTGSTIDFTDAYTFYTPQNDIFGTLVVVPTLCNTYIKNIGIAVYGDDGFSPDIYSTKIPWPISVANETFQIKAELFDINNNLIYSNLNVIQSFDPSGSTLIPFIPGGGSYQDLHVSGSLYVSQSIFVQDGDIFIPNLVPRPGNPQISQSRIVSVRADGALVFDPIVDISGDSEYVYLTIGDGTNRLDSTVVTIQSLASQYDALAGRKIYFVTGSKVIETSP